MQFEIRSGQISEEQEQVFRVNNIGWLLVFPDELVT